MDYQLLPALTYCKSLLDGSIGLVLYTHVPAVVGALGFAIWIAVTARDAASRRLVAVALLFAAWGSVNVALWVAFASATLVMMLWSLLGLLTVALFLAVHLFVHRMVTGTELRGAMAWCWGVLVAPAVVVTPTLWNVASFDLSICSANENAWFTGYYFGVGAAAMVMCWMSWRSTGTEGRSRAALVVLLGSEAFLATFLVTGALASYLVEAGVIVDFGIEQFGVASMAGFIAVLAFAAVRYEAFKVRLLGSAVLVAGLVIATGGQLLYVDTTTERNLALVSLLLVSVAGTALARSVAAVDRLSRDKSEFISIASHEIRNPVTGIRNVASAMLEGDFGEVPEHLRATLAETYMAAQSVLGRIAAYMDKSKLELGKLSYNLRVADVGVVAQRAVGMAGITARAKGISLTLKVEDGCRARIDEDKLGEVVENLISNALKFTPRGGCVEVRVRKLAGVVEIAVTDNGPGISSATLGVLFAKFERGDGRQSGIEGTGIGLWLARAHVSAMGGIVLATSAGEAKGSTFTVRLPLVQSERGAV